MKSLEFTRAIDATDNKRAHAIVSGLGAWFAERFPVKNFVFFAVLYTTALLVSRALAISGTVSVTSRDALGVVATVAFFLTLRVLDEHKDFEGDVGTHPKRVLQRGLVSLGQLRVVGAIAVTAQLGFVLLADRGLGRVTLWWTIVALWTTLMTCEFFAAEYLRPRLVLYAALHMMVMPLVMLWIAQVGAGSAAFPAAVWPLAALGFTTGAAFEIGRKLRAPEDELTGVDSYTKALGVRSATVGLALATLFSAALTVVLVSNVAPTSRVPYVLVVVGSLSAVVSGVRFARTPSSETANAANNGVALAHLASYAALLVAVIAERGVAWA